MGPVTWLAAGTVVRASTSATAVCTPSGKTMNGPGALAPGPLGITRYVLITMPEPKGLVQPTGQITTGGVQIGLRPADETTIE